MTRSPDDGAARADRDEAAASRGRPAPGRAADLDALLAAKEIAVCTGAGGVGKTTTAAAAAAMAAVHHGGRVLVLTVDPARRLADALGVGALGNDESEVPPAAFRAAGARPRGRLFAAMLDTKASWDDLVRRHAPDRQAARRILENPLYQEVTARFVASHDYIAMERLYELHERGDYDLVVVDTPPSRNALDFLEAPRRMEEFFSSRLLRWLLAPGRSRLAGMASRPFSQIADRILGNEFVSDLAEFFLSLEALHEGFVERARAVRRVLAEPRTTFLVVTTLEPGPRQEAEHLVAALRERGLHLGAVVVNKVLPAYLRDPAALATAGALRDAAAEAGTTLGPAMSSSPELVAGVLREVGESFLNYAVVAGREARQRAELSVGSEVVAEAPFLDDDVTDLAGLLRLGRAIWSLA